MNVQELSLLKEFMKQKESRFASLKYRTKTGKLSLFTVRLNVDYLKVLRRDLKVLEAVPTEGLTEIEKQGLSKEIESVKKSIVSAVDGTVNEDYTSKDVYEALCRGIKYHKENGTIYVNAFKHSETVLEPGDEKPVKHSELTLARKKFSKLTMKGKFRQFILAPESVTTAKLNGVTLEISNN